MLYCCDEAIRERIDLKIAKPQLLTAADGETVQWNLCTEGSPGKAQQLQKRSFRVSAGCFGVAGMLTGLETYSLGPGKKGQKAGIR